MASIFAGATLSAFCCVICRCCYPGRLFLVMRLSRILVIFLMWIEPPFWLLVVATIGWGLNMGITTNLARSVVQESAPKPIWDASSVFGIGMVGSAPLGAIVLGWLIEATGTLNALIPAMLLSALLFLYGALFSPVWAYRSRGRERMLDSTVGVRFCQNLTAILGWFFGSGEPNLFHYLESVPTK